MSAEAPALGRCNSGISGLNHIWGGGFPEGALYLIQGNPGLGKTTLAMQFLLAGARRGESCLYVTFSETRDELSAVAHSHGWALDGIDVLDLSNFAQQLTAEAENTLFDPGDIELHDVTKIFSLKSSGSNLGGRFLIRCLSSAFFRRAPFDIGAKF